jgi:molybdopterin-biosynthesis enzyme MoeA-like protein
VPPRAAPGPLAPARCTYVLTTGWIGLTHGDVIAECVAKAFGVAIDSDPRTLATLHNWVKMTGVEMNEAPPSITTSPAE